MAKLKMPDPAKVYEALTAVADRRVAIIEDGRAEVRSSEGDKTYTVRWLENAFSSSDPSARFHKTVSYPIIAVLLETERIAYDADLAERLKGVQWKSLNDRYKRNYAQAVDSVRSDLGNDAPKIREMVSDIYAALEAMSLDQT